MYKEETLTLADLRGPDGWKDGPMLLYLLTKHNLYDLYSVAMVYYRKHKTIINS